MASISAKNVLAKFLEARSELYYVLLLTEDLEDRSSIGLVDD